MNNQVEALTAHDPIKPVPRDMLANAIMVGSRAYAGRDRMAPLAGQYAPSLWMEDEDDGLQLVTFTNHPLNRFAMSILDANPFDRDTARALLFRSFLFADVMNDKRAAPYRRDDTAAHMVEVDDALIEAVAQVPHAFMAQPNFDEIFRRAADAVSGQPRLPLADPAPVRCGKPEDENHAG
ncbi:MAG: hypothetical protein RIA64_01770 [Rhodospirillales bacterium]